MEDIVLFKTAQTAALILVIVLLFTILKLYARNTQKKFGIRKSRYFAIRRTLRISSLAMGMLVLLVVWDINLKNIWVHLTGILAITAIAFFAVWSLVGNLLAGILLYFTSPFKLDDEIEVMPDEIHGTVLAINSFYTVVQDADANYINIPNSLFFQKYIRVKSTHSKFWKGNHDTVDISENED